MKNSNRRSLDDQINHFFIKMTIMKVGVILTMFSCALCYAYR